MLGWVILLTAVGMVVAGLAAWTVQRARIDERIDAALAQEVAELRGVAEAGDPATGAPWESLEALFIEALRIQVPDQHESLMAVVDGASTFIPSGVRPFQLEEDPAVLAELTAGSAARYGDLDLDVGAVRYAAVPVRVDGDPARGTFVAAYAVDLERAELASAMRTYGIAATIALLVVALGGWIVAGRLLRPLNLLRRTARRISETDLAERIPVRDSDDDVAELARTFNAMLDRLEQAFATQRHFLDDAGHELRTPITIVRGHLELLDPDDPRDVRETTALLLDEVDRMARLVDDLVTLAKAERPDFVRASPVQIAVLTDDVLDKARALGERSWCLDARADEVLRADPQRLTQALVQLAANAVDHTRTGDVIGIGSSVDRGIVRLWVRDTGSGIAPGDAERLFERFARGAGRGRAESSGLGLAIVRAIAEAHGGRVVLQSFPGVGSTFTLELPLVGARKAEPVEVRT